MSKIKQVTRSFEYNGIRLPEINSTMTVDETKEHYAATFPELANATAEVGAIHDGKQIIRFTKSIGTKG